MDRELLYFLLSLSIVPAAAIGLVRFPGSDKAYRPFLYYVFVSLVNELVSRCLPEHPKTGLMADLNLFSLVEFFLLLWQFRRWRWFAGFTWLYYTLAGGFLLLWVVENLLYSVMTKYNPWFLLLHCFAIVLLSIHIINRVVTDVSEPVYKNARFIICAGFIIFFTYNLLVSALFLLTDKKLIVQFFEIHVYINTLTNLLYAAGVYFIPKKTREIAFLNT